ncbi:MAG: ATP-binding protein [Methylococcales bacterium]|nr:ATP-binding protein [Methylococcales bacterium]MDD5755411.1 ATP-binding protein [Methylococcales bacterium]
MSPLVYRLARLRGLAFLGLLLLALGILGGMIWRTSHHFETALSYVNYSHRIQNVSVDLQQSVITRLANKTADSSPKLLTTLLSEIDGLMTDRNYLSVPTRQHLENVRALLAQSQSLDKNQQQQSLILVLKAMSEILDNETVQREQMLEDINRDTQSELYVALLMFATILIGAILFLKRRILHPLNDLRELLEHLTDENYTPIATKHIDPLLLPVFYSYNGMVKHLAELEGTKREYAQSLQREVRLATQALLEQQHSLARAERLAAIGEVSAELAHEIRNPLAGIQMAFNNLRREIDNENQCERMALIDSELKRLARLLNEMLNTSKHTPETPSHFDLSVLIRDLVTLVRYQIPENLNLQFVMPETLPVCLPESGLRQALLNLLLNSADALEGKRGDILISANMNADGLQIQVHDNGHGFAREWLDYGIRPFRTSRERGTGLGLAMVQRFVKNNHGSLTLNNDNGAVVSVMLPNQFSGTK